MDSLCPKSVNVWEAKSTQEAQSSSNIAKDCDLVKLEIYDKIYMYIYSVCVCVCIFTHTHRLSVQCSD